MYVAVGTHMSLSAATIAATHCVVVCTLTVRTVLYHQNVHEPFITEAISNEVWWRHRCDIAHRRHDLCDVTNNTTFTGPQPEYVPLACTGDFIPSCSASAWTRQWLQSKHTLSEVYSSKLAIYTTVSNLVFTCVIATTYGTSSSRADLITEAAIFQGYFPISVSNPNLIIIVHIIHENLTERIWPWDRQTIE